MSKWTRIREHATSYIEQHEPCMQTRSEHVDGGCLVFHVSHRDPCECGKFDVWYGLMVDGLHCVVGTPTKEQS